MKLIIGLGNQGIKYIKTRHNFGFLAVDYFHKNSDAFSAWVLDKNSNALVSNGEITDKQILLAKPQTFMNLSGSAVASLAHFYRITPEDIWIIHDDFDLPLGILRLSQNSSCAGHKGVKSIIEVLGTKDFTRFRLGIHPVGKSFNRVRFKKMDSMEKFVLKNFAKEEKKIVAEVIKKTAQAMELALKKGVAEAMNEFN